MLEPWDELTLEERIRRKKALKNSLSKDQIRIIYPHATDEELNKVTMRLKA